MMINSYTSLDKLCFSDFSVISIELDEKMEIFQINLDGIWFVENNTPKELGRGYIKIRHFAKFTASYSNNILKKEGCANVKQIKQIREINDHEIGSDYLKIFGFIADGAWVECKIEGGEVEAFFTDAIHI